MISGDFSSVLFYGIRIEMKSKGAGTGGCRGGGFAGNMGLDAGCVRKSKAAGVFLKVCLLT